VSSRGSRSDSFIYYLRVMIYMKDVDIHNNETDFNKMCKDHLKFREAINESMAYLKQISPNLNKEDFSDYLDKITKPKETTVFLIFPADLEEGITIPIDGGYEVSR